MTDHMVGAIEHRMPQRMDGIGWGLFFIWIGIVLLAQLSWGIALLGIGILILGGQLTRKQLALPLETFWVVVGIFFTMGGAWVLLGIRIGLMPLFCILVGVVLLASALFAKPKAA